MDLWLSHTIDEFHFHLLNLDHPEIESRILHEMQTGVDVYYDRRWDTTEILTRRLIQNPQWLRGKSILVLGAGVGLETLIAGHFCKTLYVNDLAPVSLQLCAEQLNRNGIDNFTLLPGRYDQIDLPDTDLILGSFIVYDAETLQAMQTLLTHRSEAVMLINENLAAFKKLLKCNLRPMQMLFAEQAAICVLFPALK